MARARRGCRVSGGLFQSNFPEPSNISSNSAEEQVLQKLVSDYNASGNPGRFVVRKEAEGRYAVVGVSRRDDAGRDEEVHVLLFDADRNDYRLGLESATKTETDANGRQIIQFIKHK